MAALFDFTAPAVRGGKCWIARTPGTRIFFDCRRRTHLDGRRRPGITAPLKVITFADDQHGWAVGELGAILATCDGGQTWKRQSARPWGTRSRSAALMAVAGRAEDLPLELSPASVKIRAILALLKLSAGRMLTPIPRAIRLWPTAASGSVCSAGGAARKLAWGFPCGRLEMATSSTDGVPGTLEPLSERPVPPMPWCGHLVRQIRTWRPERGCGRRRPQGRRPGRDCPPVRQIGFQVGRRSELLTETFTAAGWWTVDCATPLPQHRAVRLRGRRRLC